MVKMQLEEHAAKEAKRLPARPPPKGFVQELPEWARPVEVDAGPPPVKKTKLPTPPVTPQVQDEPPAPPVTSVDGHAESAL